MRNNLSPWGKSVKIRQIELGLSNEALAKKAGLSVSYMGSIVNGRVISPNAVKAISDAVGIAVPADSSKEIVT